MTSLVASLRKPGQLESLRANSNNDGIVHQTLDLNTADTDFVALGDMIDTLGDRMAAETSWNAC